MSFLTWLLLIMVLFLSPPPTLAQVGGEQPYHVEAGPYQLDVLANPSNLSLGTVEYLVRVYGSQTGQPVPDARVRIRSRHAEGGQSGWANALNTPESPAEYSARINLDEPGIWEMSVDVSSDLGRVEVEVPSQAVPEPSQSAVGSLVFAGVFAVLILGALYLVWTIRRAQRKREARNAG